ncbi:hypothetical protein U2A4042140071 [Corynebacterium striatum]|nr:hypothetical protein U2A4042140071 [Corynebacterium striatum]
MTLQPTHYTGIIHAYISSHPMQMQIFRITLSTPLMG